MAFVGILGHGTVGSGVVEVLHKNEESIAKRAGQEIKVKKILDRSDFSNLPYGSLFTKNIDDILNDSEINIIVEVMGGINPAYEFTKRALVSGKHVVTSNKELVAEHGAELQRIAHENKVNYLFEASVGGGIPIIRPLRQCLAGNEITEITGILNGTTNFVLSEMKNKGKDFIEALTDAQERGYAERDPSADIQGWDTQRKIAILSSIAFRQHVRFKDIKVKGITDISKDDIAMAGELGYVIKLIANTKRTEDGIMARVSPTLLPSGHPLADVEDVFNAILVKGDAIGDVMFYGRGAGKFPTASAVVGDIIEASKHVEGMNGEVLYDETYVELLGTDHVQGRYIIRVRVKDIDSFKLEAEQLAGSAAVHELSSPFLEREAAVITETMKEIDFDNMREALSALSSVEAIIQALPIAEASN